ncbi:MAG: radical SAM protein [Candidatus Moraniibacteriota bacterium]
MKSSKSFLTQNISAIFQNEFPIGYQNNVKYWGNIPKEELHSLLPDGTAKLLTMDVDFGNHCSLRCPHCFRRDDRFDKIDSTHQALSPEEILGYIKEAKKLGLKEIKILGRGEPFENHDFLGFLREMSKMDIGVGIFTKGHVLGSDALARKYNSQYGIHTSEELIAELYRLKVSIFLGFNSFDKKMQKAFVGAMNSPIKEYVKFRDDALIALVKAGFNKYVPGEATRLAMIAAPIKPENVEEVFDIFTWARVRNIYMLSCPTVMSGKGSDELKRGYGEYSGSTSNQCKLYIADLEKLYVKIYRWSISTKLISAAKLKEDGISMYPGCHVCNQTAAGFYLNLSGQINLCAGRCDESTIFSSDIRKEKSLKDVWMRCPNYKRAMNKNVFNCHCPARDNVSIPPDFYESIGAEI